MNASDFDAKVAAAGLDPKKIVADTQTALRVLLIVMLGHDHRIAMTAAFIALACFATNRTPDELPPDVLDIYKDLMDKFKPLLLTSKKKSDGDDLAAMASPSKTVN